MSLRKRPSFAKSFHNSIDSSAKIFAAAKPSLAHECHFAAQEPPFRSCETAAKLQSMKIPNFAAKAPFRRVFRSCENPLLLRNWPSSAKIKMTFNIMLFFYKNGSFELRKGFRKRKRHSNRLFIPLPELDDARTSGHLFRSNFVNPIWREPEEPNLPLLPAANESRERHLFKAPPLNLRGQKLLHLR